MKILLVGATGFIGKHLVDSLRRRHQVFALAKSVPRDVPSNVQWIVGDLTRPLECSRLPGRIDGVVHLAQSEHFREFPKHSVELFQVNTVSTLLLLEYARTARARRFIYASSGGIHGSSDYCFTEDDAIKQRGELGFYLGSKLCSEILCDCYASFMNVVILRFFFVYGPGQRESMLVPRLVHCVREGLPIRLQGKNGIRINPTYVSDAVEAITAALTLKTSQKINIGGPQVLSLRRIGEIIGDALGKKAKFKRNQKVEPQHLIGDIRKMSAMLLRPKVRFQIGIRRYLENE
jgi:UDP-glucose 4-epimerase